MRETHMLRECTIEGFLEEAVKYKQIVCYGAGRRLELLAMVLKDSIVWKKIEYIVDGDKAKHNSKIAVNGKELSIISLEELKKKSLDNFAIIITCAQFSEVVEWLDSDSTFCETNYYSLSLIMEKDAMQKGLAMDIRVTDKPLIPKTIHYCWFGRKPIPDKNRIWMESWYKYCPGYKFIEWNEDNYDVSKNKYMYQAYKNKKWGFVPDYARLDIIYQHGGIYLDTDVELVKNIDDLCYQKGFVGFQNRLRVNLGSGFGAVAGLDILKTMMEIYDNMEFEDKDGNLNLIASPKWQTQVLESYGLKKNGEHQCVAGLTVYPEKLLCGKNMYTRKILLKPYTMAIHHFEGSWLDYNTKDMLKKIEKTES